MRIYTYLSYATTVLMFAACNRAMEVGTADLEQTNWPYESLADSMQNPIKVAAAACGDDTQNASKVLVCHVPPGNPAAKHTICIGAPAVDAHLNKHHGGKSLDYLGDCAVQPTPMPSPDPTSQPTTPPTPMPDPTSQPTTPPTPMPTAQPTTPPTPMPTSVPTAPPAPQPTATPTPDNF